MLVLGARKAIRAGRFGRVAKNVAGGILARVKKCGGFSAELGVRGGRLRVRRA